MATEFSASTTQDLHDQQRTEQISNLNRLLDKYIGLAANTILPNPTDNRTISQPYSQGPVTSNSADTQAQEFDRITDSFPQGLENPPKFQTQPRYGDANTITSERYQVQAEGNRNTVDIVSSTSDQINLDWLERVNPEGLTAEELKRYHLHPEYRPNRRPIYGQAFSPSSTPEKKNRFSPSKPQISQHASYSNQQQSRFSSQEIHQNNGIFEYPNYMVSAPQNGIYSTQNAQPQGSYPQQNEYEWIKPQDSDMRRCSDEYASPTFYDSSNLPNQTVIGHRLYPKERELKSIPVSVQVSDNVFPSNQQHNVVISGTPSGIRYQGVEAERHFLNSGRAIIPQSKLSPTAMSNSSQPKLFKRTKSTEDLVEENLQKLEQSVVLQKIGEDQIEGVERDHSFILNTQEIESKAHEIVYSGSHRKGSHHQYSPQDLTHPERLSADSEGKALGGEPLAYEVVIEQYSDGSRYEGEKHLGKRHGKGIFYFKEGFWLDGNWEEGFFTGYGTLWLNKDTKIYEGEWLNNVFHGRGAMYNHEIKNSQDIDGTNFRALKGGWMSFEGLFNSGMKQGLGKLVLANGDVFVGNFVRDVIHGRGSYTAKGKKAFVGYWKENVLFDKL